MSDVFGMYADFFAIVALFVFLYIIAFSAKKDRQDMTLQDISRLRVLFFSIPVFLVFSALYIIRQFHS